MICVNCGKEISDDSKFCGFCGITIVPPVSVTEAAPAPAMGTNPVAESVPVPEPAPAPEPTPVIVPEPVQFTGFMPNQAAVPPTPMQDQAAVPPTPVQGQTAIPPMQGQPMNYAQNPTPMSPMPMQTQPVGAIPPAVPPAEDGKKKKGKAGIIVLIMILVLLLAGGGVLAFMFLNRPIGKINKALEAGDIETVVELYESLSDDKDKAEVSEKLLSYAEEARDDYLNEDISYGEAIDTLSLLAGARLETNHEIDAILEFVNRIYFSRESYAAAEAYRANGEYAMALENYDAVISEDSLYYNKALIAIQEVRNELVNAAIEEANAYINSGDYVLAEYVLNEAMLALPGGSSELESALAAVRESAENNIIHDVIEDANIAIAEGRYSEAREMLQDALVLYPDNADLQEALAGLVSDNTLVGTWILEYDMQELLAEEMGSGFDDFESSLIVPLIFEFTEDGTFRMYVGEELKDNIMEYIIDYVCDMVGMDRSLLESAVVSMYGSWEAFFEEIMEEDMDDMLDELMAEIEEMEETAFYEVQGNRIYIFDEYGNVDYNDSYETFEVIGDTLLIYFEGEEEIFPGLSYPLTLTRVANNH